MYVPTTLLTALIAVATIRIPAAGGGLIAIVQNNILGSPEFHKTQSWPFDPDVAARRAPGYIELHGDKSEKLIERIGLGIDGRQHERREQQMVKDFLYDKQQQQHISQYNKDYNYQQEQRQQSNFLRFPIPRS